MQRQEIIDLANDLTERKAEGIINVAALYRFILQDICKRERFWWRKVQSSFPTVIGTKTYDLTTVTLTPAMTEIVFDEITKLTIILTASPLQVQELTPIFDDETILEMVQNTTNVAPVRYTMNPSDYKTLLLDPPDKIYTTYIVGWAMPNPPTDSSSDVVPLIPPWGHNTIVTGLMAKIFRHAYGSKNDKTVDAVAEYEQGIQDLMQRKQFDPNYKLQLTISDDQSGAMQGAIRST